MGKTFYSIEGLNLDYLIEKIHKSDIDLSDVNKESNKKLFFSVKNSDVNKLVALLKDSCYNISVEKTTGKPKVFKFLISRIGLIAGLLVFVIVAAVYGSAVRNITYLNDAVDYSEEINEVLAEENITAGSRGIDTKALSNKILSKISDFVFVSCNVEGVNLNISAFEKSNLSAINEKVDLDIVSAFDGVVTRIYVLSGTALVKSGDRVVKGQTLIEGIIGPQENSAKVLAVGEVYGIVDVVYTEYFDTVVNVPFRTGNYYTVNSLTLFNMSFPAKSENVSNFKNFEKEIFEDYLFYGMILPFKRVREVYYEVNYQSIERDFDKVSNIIIAEAKKKALLLVEEGLTVQDAKTDIKSLEGKKIITITLTCEKKMSVAKIN